MGSNSHCHEADGFENTQVKGLVKKTDIRFHLPFKPDVFPFPATQENKCLHAYERRDHSPSLLKNRALIVSF